MGSLISLNINAQKILDEVMRMKEYPWQKQIQPSPPPQKKNKSVESSLLDLGIQDTNKWMK
jgi:hypothetical protein